MLDASRHPIPEKIPPLELRAGEPFGFVAERESLRRLYAMGDFSDIRATASQGPNGLQIDFIVDRNFYNNVVRVEGLNPPPSDSAALAAMRLGLGQPFRESALRESIARLGDLLRSDGFYLPKISWSLTPHPDTRQMDIAIDVETGPRARMGAIGIDNQTPYPDRRILRQSKLSSKNTLTSALLSRASQRLKKFLVDQGYLGAGVVIAPQAYDPHSNRVPLNVKVTAGPRVRIEITGARVSKSKRRKLLPMYAEGAVDEDLLQEGRRNLRNYFQSQGYFDATVEVHSRLEASDNLRVISYQISRGDRFRLAGVAFDGNKYFGTNLLSARLKLQPASFASSGRFSQQMMRDDADSIRALYLANGFRDAQVSTDVDDSYRGKRNNLFVTFHIVEGAQTRIASLKIEGNHAISTATLLSVSGSTPGQPYSQSGVASDRNNILALYFNQGFPDARMDDQVSASPDHEVNVVYRLIEGRQVEVSSVLLTGYEFTRRGIIASQVSIHPDEPLRQGDVAATQRRLYNLGVFNRVQIAPQNPDGTDPKKTVVVDVTEGDRYTIGYGFGFEVQRIAGGTNNPNGSTIGASPRGIFEIARNNMFGRAQTLSLTTRASTLEYRASLNYAASNFLNDRNLALDLTSYADKTQDINTFTSTRFEAGFQISQRASSSSSLLYRYFYRRVEASNLVSTINPEQIPLLSQPTLVSGFGITYARDRRDNPADATRGTFNSVDFSDAIERIGSSASYLRGFFQNSSYYSFGRAFVFARSVRFGVEEPMGNTVPPYSPDCVPNTAGAISCVTIPLPERFYAGGGTSLRGFGLNQAGPRDTTTGFPIGGLALLIFNQELRFPMRLPVIGNRLGGTVFYDGGNVYADIYHISLAWKSKSPTDLDYWSNTVGFGLRYPTPVGPVRVDFGFLLNPAQYQYTPVSSTTPITLQIPHFGFSFNIGPVF
ncbi:MAG TPA: POTRA domain-containing protein [Candidatus Dormibacteraeota bacterium]|nr:POTRA domain-containing protein [Candidatus Dormibacteraeota bacterium]